MVSRYTREFTQLRTLITAQQQVDVRKVLVHLLMRDAEQDDITPATMAAVSDEVYGGHIDNEWRIIAAELYSAAVSQRTSTTIAVDRFKHADELLEWLEGAGFTVALDQPLLTVSWKKTGYEPGTTNYLHAESSFASATAAHEDA